MRMSKISLIAAIALGGLLACGTPAMAQDAKQGGKRPTLQQRVDKMAEELKLTDEQKTKVKALFEDEAKKRQELRDVPQDQRREKAKALAEDTTKKMKEILKPDQFEKWEKMRQEMRKKGEKKPADSTK
jgi:periplasmic protein CpxP/Spy